MYKQHGGTCCRAIRLNRSDWPIKRHWRNPKCITSERDALHLLCTGTLLIALLLLISSAAIAQAPASRVFAEVGIDQKLNEQIQLDLEFRNEEGETVKLAQYFHGKPVVISLVYYNCPMLCTQILNGMVETFRIIKFTAGNEFEVVTVSIDPTESHELAVEKKQQYIEAYDREGVAGGWHFLTGDEEMIKKLADAVGFRYMYDEKSGEYAHGSAIMVATPDGRVSRYHYGIEYGGKDLTFALMESSKGKIGSPVDKLLLLCYHYDPSTGTYSILVTNLLRAGGIVALVILGGFMFINFRRDRKQQAIGSAKA